MCAKWTLQRARRDHTTWRRKAEVQVLIDGLALAGGRVLRGGDAPLHHSFRGHVGDPDDHAWEIAWNPPPRAESDHSGSYPVAVK